MKREPYRAVSILDMALDIEAMGEDVLKYAYERDPSLLRFLPASRPTWFNFKRIPVSVFHKFVAAGATESDRHYRAFMAGCSSIEQIVPLNGGEPIERLEPTGSIHSASGEWTIWKEQEVDLIEPAYVAEMGAVLHTWSGLPKGFEQRYAPPQLSLQGYLARVSHLAAATLQHARQSSGKAKAQPRPLRSRSGGKRTDATATAKATTR